MLCKIWSSVVFRQTVFLEHYRRSYESTLVSVGVLHLVEDIRCPCLLVHKQCVPVLSDSVRDICFIKNLAPLITVSCKEQLIHPCRELFSVRNEVLLRIVSRIFSQFRVSYSVHEDRIMSVILRHSDLQPLVVLGLVNHCQRVAVLPSFHRESAAV